MHLHQKRAEDHCRPSWVIQVGFQLALALVVSVLVVSPRTLLAQDAPAQQPVASEADAREADADESSQKRQTRGDEFFGEQHRRQMYEQSKLSTTRAVLYNLAVPGLGNMYAEQYFYGGIAFSLMVFAVVFVSYGFVTDQPEFLWIGGTTAAITYTGSIATSIYGVREYNEKLRQGLKLEGAFSQGPWGLPEARTMNVAIEF